VARFQVPVDDSSTVGGVERVGEFNSDRHRPRNRKWSLDQRVRERRPFEKFRDAERPRGRGIACYHIVATLCQKYFRLSVPPKSVVKIVESAMRM